MEQSEERREQEDETTAEAEHREEEDLDPTEAKAKEIEDDPSANPQDDLLRGIKGG